MPGIDLGRQFWWTTCLTLSFCASGCSIAIRLVGVQLSSCAISLKLSILFSLSRIVFSLLCPIRLQRTLGFSFLWERTPNVQQSKSVDDKRKIFSKCKNQEICYNFITYNFVRYFIMWFFIQSNSNLPIVLSNI